jgi:hypothetical protein
MNRLRGRPRRRIGCQMILAVVLITINSPWNTWNFAEGDPHYRRSRTGKTWRTVRGALGGGERTERGAKVSLLLPLLRAFVSQQSFSGKI